MAVMLRARRLGKTRVVAGHKVGCKGIGVGHVADSAKPQLLDQAILQSEVRTLHTTFGLAAVGAALDVQLVHRSAELGIAVAALRRLVVTAEHAGFVAVEGQRLSIIDLDQFAATGAPVAWLIDLGRPCLRGTHMPASTMIRRTVSLASLRPWHSTSFSWARVGPKSL